MSFSLLLLAVLMLSTRCESDEKTPSLETTSSSSSSSPPTTITISNSSQNGTTLLATLSTPSIKQTFSSPSNLTDYSLTPAASTISSNTSNSTTTFSTSIPKLSSTGTQSVSNITYTAGNATENAITTSRSVNLSINVTTERPTTMTLNSPSSSLKPAATIEEKTSSAAHQSSISTIMSAPTKTKTNPPATNDQKTTISKTSDSVTLKGKSPKALSSGSVAAIVICFIIIVIGLLWGAYYLKIRRPSYGRLLDDTEQGAGGIFMNPMFDD